MVEPPVPSPVDPESASVSEVPPLVDGSGSPVVVPSAPVDPVSSAVVELVPVVLASVPLDVDELGSDVSSLSVVSVVHPGRARTPAAMA